MLLVIFKKYISGALAREARAAEHPLTKFGKLSIRENLVMT